jgi:hypothetical protein
MKRCHADFWPGPQPGWTTQSRRPADPLSRPLFSDSGQTCGHSAGSATAAITQTNLDATYPFQIPLGALLPQRLDNLLAAGKCLGVTHVTNGCYRLHSVEWNVGEAAGALAAYCLNQRVSPRAVRSSPTLLADFQRILLSMGVQLHWPEEIQTRVR